MIAESEVALFLMLGQSAELAVRADPQLVPAQTLPISASIDIAESLPEVVSAANHAAEEYRLFFVFETYLRELIIEVLSNDPTVPWWNKIPAARVPAGGAGGPRALARGFARQVEPPGAPRQAAGSTPPPARAPSRVREGTAGRCPLDR